MGVVWALDGGGKKSRCKSWGTPEFTVGNLAKMGKDLASDPYMNWTLMKVKILQLTKVSRILFLMVKKMVQVKGLPYTV